MAVLCKSNDRVKSIIYLGRSTEPCHYPRKYNINALTVTVYALIVYLRGYNINALTVTVYALMVYLRG